MRVNEAAAKWKRSVNSVRKYLDDGLLFASGATLKIDAPVPYYFIPPKTKCPVLAMGKPNAAEQKVRRQLRKLWRTHVRDQRLLHKQARLAAKAKAKTARGSKTARAKAA